MDFIVNINNMDNIVNSNKEGYFSPDEQKAYTEAVNKLYKKTGVSISDEPLKYNSFEEWWAYANMTYTRPRELSKQWCRLAFEAARERGSVNENNKL